MFDENIIKEEIGTKRENDSLRALCQAQNMKDEKGKKETKEREEIIRKQIKERKWPRYEKKMRDKVAEKRGRRNLEGNVRLQNSSCTCL